jgi:hypothetical protein
MTARKPEVVPFIQLPLRLQAILFVVEESGIYSCRELL